MKYLVSGLIRNRTKFSMEVEAKSENHAAKLAITKIGSAQRLKSTSIKVSEVKMVK